MLPWAAPGNDEYGIIPARESAKIREIRVIRGLLFGGELEYLAGRVQEFEKLTKRVCQRKIESFLPAPDERG